MQAHNEVTGVTTSHTFLDVAEMQNLTPKAFFEVIEAHKKGLLKNLVTPIVIKSGFLPSSHANNDKLSGNGSLDGREKFSRFLKKYFKRHGEPSKNLTKRLK